MTGWRTVLAAMIAWAVHFFGAYALMLAFPQSQIVPWLTITLGLACLVFLATLMRSRPANAGITSAVTVAGVGIFWQSLVGLF